MTSFPVDSRTTVLGLTQEGLTSGFEKRPGKLHRYDRAPIFLRIGYLGATLNVANELALTIRRRALMVRSYYTRKKDARTLVLLD